MRILQRKQRLGVIALPGMQVIFMNKNVIIYYKVASYILIVAAGLLSLMDLTMLFIALVNPILLWLVFAITAVIIYTFTSFSFFNRNILKEAAAKKTLKDWIKINGYISIAFSAYYIMGCLYLILKPSEWTQIINQMVDTNNKMGAGSVPRSTIQSFYHNSLYCILAYQLILLSHVIISLRLVKLYNNLFSKE